MKFRLWIWKQNIKRKLKAIYYNQFLIWFRSTLIYNLLKVFLLVIIILWTIFLFAPKSAHVSVHTNEVEAVGKIYTDYINMELESERFCFTNFEELEIEYSFYDEIEVENRIYDGTYKIKVEPLSEEGAMIFVTVLDSEKLPLTINSFSNGENSLVYINYMAKEFSVKGTNGFKIKYNNNLQFTFFDCNAFLVKEGEQNIPINNCIMKVDKKYGSIISIKSNIQLEVKKYLGEDTIHKANLFLYGLKTISAKLSGDLNFSYSPESKQYHLNDQIVYLLSEYNSLEAEIKFDNGINELDLNGMVDEASISKMNLFPTFLGWYRDNIYLAPLTLLTTVFGGVTLMINNKKKN